MFALQYVSPSIRYPPEWIHDPKAENPKIEQVFIPLHETWNGMEELVNIHKITKHIGVCNLNVQLLSDLLSYCNIKPLVNQVEMHPYLNQKSLVEFCQMKGIPYTDVCYCFILMFAIVLYAELFANVFEWN